MWAIVLLVSALIALSNIQSISADCYNISSSRAYPESIYLEPEPSSPISNVLECESRCMSSANCVTFRWNENTETCSWYRYPLISINEDSDADQCKDDCDILSYCAVYQTGGDYNCLLFDSTQTATASNGFNLYVKVRCEF